MKKTKKGGFAAKIIAVLAFAVLVTQVAPAQANIMYNGGFDASSVGWPRGNSSTIMTGQTIGGDVSALGPSGVAAAKVGYQIVDAAHLGDGSLYTVNNSLGQAAAAMPANENGTSNPGWIPAATSETYTFSYQNYISAGTGSEEVRLYAYTGAGAPPYDVNSQSYNYIPGGAVSPLSNWTLLYDSGTLGSTSGWVTNNVPIGTISGNPEYFAVVLNATKGTSTGGVGFDSISLDTQSAVPTPLPAAAWLLGSGLMGLLGIRRRKLL
jgi:predicted phage tail protein